MTDLMILCLNEKCRHRFLVKNVKPGDIRTCFKCGFKRKITRVHAYCEACGKSYDLVMQDGIRVTTCPNPKCGNYNPVFNPIYVTSKRDRRGGKGQKKK